MLRSISRPLYKQSGQAMVSVLKKKRKVMVGREGGKACNERVSGDEG